MTTLKSKTKEMDQRRAGANAGRSEFHFAADSIRQIFANRARISAGVAAPLYSARRQRFLFEFAARESVAGIALRLFNLAFECATVASLRDNLRAPAMRVEFFDLGIEFHGNFFAESRDARILERAFEFSDPGASEKGDQTQHGAHGEFRLMHRLRIDDRAEHIHGALIQVHGNASDRFRLD